jgi:hypothetical protein
MDLSNRSKISLPIIAFLIGSLAGLLAARSSILLMFPLYISLVNQATDFLALV